jgi:uncharacterized SAM-binding protein YcdF (DUF218 family)
MLMFLLSKLIWIFAQPLSLAFFSAVLAALFSFAGWQRLGGSAAMVSALVLFVTLYTTAGSMALQALEARYPKPGADPDGLSCMIVLGGVFESEVTAARGGFELNQSADRFVEAARLALKYPQARILVSGGDGSFSGTYEGEAEASERFFSAFNIAADRLIKENTSRTTYENTMNTRELLQSMGLQDCTLITSAFHMPRSIALFRKAGIPVTPWPTDFRTSGQVSLRLDFTQPALNAQLTATALREWMALVGYRLAGRIDSW